MEADLTPHEIIRRMDTAFESVPYAGDDLLPAHDCPAARRLCDGLRGRPPGAISDEFVAQHHDGLALLSPEARRHYLPAWTRAALRQPGWEVTEFVLYALAGDLRWQLEGYAGLVAWILDLAFLAGPAPALRLAGRCRHGFNLGS